MNWDKVKEWINNNRWVLYSSAVLCFFLINGMYLFKNTGGNSKSILVLTGIIVIIWILLCLIVFQWRKKNFQKHHIFLAILITLGTSYSAVFAPVAVPDELYHFECSVKYSSFILQDNPTTDTLPLRASEKEFIENYSNTLSYSLYTRVADNFELFSSNPEITTKKPLSGFSMAENTPQLKLPSVIGVTIARLLGLGTYPLFYLGRLFNFLFFAVLSYFAVKITPRGKNAFIAVSLLPMTLHLVSSYSYDAGIIGFAMILSAFLLKAIYTPEKLLRRDFIAIGIFSFLLAPCKVIYSLLVFAVLLIPRKAFSSRRNEILFKGGIFLLTFGSVCLIRLSYIIVLTGIDATASSSLNVRGVETGHFHTIHEFYTDPFGTIMMFLRSIDVMGDFFLSSVIGGTLGWFQAELRAPWIIILAFLFLLLLSFLKTSGEEEIPGKHRAVFASIFIFGSFAIFTTFFVAHTFDFEDVILGIQGRYFLPFVPLVALALQSKTIVSSKNLHMVIMFGFLALNFAYLNRIYAIATIV